MPANPSPQHGASQVIGATVYDQGVMELAAGATSVTIPVQIEGLAWAILWAFQSTGVLGAIARPEFAWRQEPGTITTQWERMLPDAGLVLLVPHVVEQRFPCRAIRWRFTAPAGNAVSINWALMGSQA